MTNNTSALDTKVKSAIDIPYRKKRWKHDNTFLFGFGVFLFVGIAISTAIFLSLLLINLFPVTVLLTYTRTPCSVTTQNLQQDVCGATGNTKFKCATNSTRVSNSTITSTTNTTSVTTTNSTATNINGTANINGTTNTNGTANINGTACTSPPLTCYTPSASLEYNVPGSADNISGQVSRYCYTNKDCTTAFFKQYAEDSQHTCLYDPNSPSSMFVLEEMSLVQPIVIAVFGGILSFFLIITMLYVIFLIVYCPIQHVKLIREHILCCLKPWCYNMTEKTKKYNKHKTSR
jgi:hypothetical protein